MQPEVEELEPALSGPGQQVAEKNELGRLQYSLDYDFQSGQVGVEEARRLWRGGSQEDPEGKLRLGALHHCTAASGHPASPGIGSLGPGWLFRPLCAGLPAARQAEAA